MQKQENPPKGIYLGFDFGTKKIGIATGQTLTKTTTELCVLTNIKDKVNFKELDNIFEQWQPVGCIVGRPVDLSGNSQQMTDHAIKFGNRLKERYKLPVFFIDEQYSTTSAKTYLKETGQFKQLRSKKVDATAASIILSAWFAL